MEVLGYLLFAGVFGMIGYHLYSRRSEKKSGQSTGGGGGRNPVNTRVKKH